MTPSALILRRAAARGFTVSGGLLVAAAVGATDGWWTDVRSDADGSVAFGDLLVVIGAWGPCPG